MRDASLEGISLFPTRTVILVLMKMYADMCELCLAALNKDVSVHFSAPKHAVVPFSDLYNENWNFLKQTPFRQCY